MRFDLWPVRLRPRWLKLWADLWESKTRTLLVVLCIAVGIYAIGMALGGYAIIPRAMDTSYAAADPANIVITTDPFDRDFLKGIRAVEGVGEAEGQRAVSVRLKAHSGEWIRIDLLARTDMEETRLEHPLPFKGASSPADREMLLLKKVADKYGFAVGETAEIELADGYHRRLPIVGIVRDLTAGRRGFLNDGVGYVTEDTLGWLEQPQSFDKLYVTVAEGVGDRAHIERVGEAVKDQVEKSGRCVYQIEYALSTRHPLASITGAILNVLAALGVLLLFLTGTLIANTLTVLLNQHTRHIGIIKLVGARRGQIVGLYLALILTFSLIALALAVPLGAISAYELCTLVADQVNFILPPLRDTILNPQVILVQVVMGILVPLAAGMVPVLNGSRISVQKALTSTGLSGDPARAGGGSVRPLRLPLGRRLSRPLLITIRNTFRRRGRLALTLSTLTLGGAIFISVFNVRLGLNATVDRSLHYFRADVNVDLARNYRIEVVERELAAFPGVRRIEEWAATRATLLRPDGSTVGAVNVLAPPVNSQMVEPLLLTGRWLLPDDENAITVNEAWWSTYPGLRPGDRVRLRVAEEEEDWTVVGVFRFTGADELFAYANYDYLSRRLHQSGQAAFYRILAEDHSLAAQKALAGEIYARLDALGYRISKIEAGNSLSRTIADVLSIVILVLLIMALLTAFVGSIGLTGTLGMNVMERTREIGVMRAIGADDRIINRLVVGEGLLIGLISFGLASVCSFPITIVLSGLVTTAIFRTPTQPAFTIQGFAVWLVADLVLCGLASVLPARSACRLTIREALAYE